MKLLHKDILEQDKDFVMSFLRRELNYLQEVLGSVENSDKTDAGYICESLKSIETKLKALRKFLGEWA